MPERDPNARLRVSALGLVDMIATDLRQMLASGPVKAPDTVKLAWAMLKVIKDQREAPLPLLEGIVTTLLPVIEDRESSPDCRLLAQRIAQNIDRWNGDSGVLPITADQHRTIAEPMRLV